MPIFPGNEAHVPSFPGIVGMTRTDREWVLPRCADSVGK